MTNRLRVAGTSLLALAFLASAWSLPARAADQTVVIGEALRPTKLEIEPGTTVTWHNRDDERHRVRSKDGPVRFDSKDLDPGESFSFTFSVAGTYPYYDHRSRDDTAYLGQMIVTDTASDVTVAEPVDLAEVTIVDDAFRPTGTTIVAGGTVEWVNRGADEHTITALDLSFDSGDLVSSARFSRIFEMAGEYAYFCAIHPEMRASVVVVEPASAEFRPDLVAEDPPAASAEPPALEPPTEFAAPDLDSALDALATPPPE